MNKRKRRYNTYKKHKTNKNWEKYTSLQYEIKRMITQAHTKYINSIFRDDDKGPRNLFRYVKSMKRDSMGIGSLVLGNRVVTSAKEKAEALSLQYSSVFTRENTASMPSKGPSPYPEMSGIIVAVAGVEKLLSSLNPKKAIGPNKVSTKILKEYAADLAPVLQIIFQQSLATGDVPEDWRRACVSAVFKKGDRCQPSNYRPVSLTSIACKVLEHIISSTIRAHLDNHNILNKF